MSRHKKSRGGKQRPRLGKRPARYRFALNPYQEARFSTCPECGRRTLLRKVPLAVHVDPHHPAVLNKRCRYCPDCDILICHQDELERLLAQAFGERTPEIIGEDYLVLGTLDKATWRGREKEPITMGDLPDLLHDFKAYLQLGYTPAHWAPAEGGGPQAEPSPEGAIDDMRQVEALLEKMGRHLPMRAEIQRRTARLLRAGGVSIPAHRQVSIKALFYHGDEGGIVCAISSPEREEAVVISLTHLRIPRSHPLEKEIRVYQKARLKKLAQGGR
jgi:hypothetical protein